MKIAFCLVSCWLLCSFTPATEAAWSDDPNYRRPFPLPKCPDGCIVVLYGPLPKGIMGLKAKKLTDWKNIFEEIGVEFPKGGFALYYPPGRMLAVATDIKNQKIVEILLE